MGVWTEPSPSDWDEWERLIRDEGSTPSDAAKLLGFGGSSAFKRSDRGRHSETLERWREDRDEGDRVTARDTFLESIRRALEPVPILHQGKATGFFEWDGGTALRAAELLGKSAGMFVDRAELEVSGPEGGPIQITQQGVSLVAVLDVLRAAGAIDAGDSIGSAREALPAARALLAESVPEG